MLYDQERYIIGKYIIYPKYMNGYNIVTQLSNIAKKHEIIIFKLVIIIFGDIMQSWLQKTIIKIV